MHARANDRSGRELHELPGMNHDILTNAGSAVPAYTLGWLGARLEHTASDAPLWVGEAPTAPAADAAGAAA
jgi:hypothetical protein